MKADYETAEKIVLRRVEKTGNWLLRFFVLFFICMGFFRALEGFCLGEKIWFLGGTVYSGVAGLVCRRWEI